ncbi:MAG: hypothetical protein O3C39_09530 [Planctomycetota bacterium]|jgi:hypothetical protein|nr:hypothetical protein [Planctomycetota bacterium]
MQIVERPSSRLANKPSRPREMPVWLPWLAAPAFALLPVMGCGAAAQWRADRGPVRQRQTVRAAPPLVPIAAVVTAVQPGR